MGATDTRMTEMGLQYMNTDVDMEDWQVLSTVFLVAQQLYISLRFLSLFFLFFCVCENPIRTDQKETDLTKLYQTSPKQS